MNMQTINLSNFYLIGEFIFQAGQVAVKLVYDVSLPFWLSENYSSLINSFYNLFVAFFWLVKMNINKTQLHFQLSSILILLFR